MNQFFGVLIIGPSGSGKSTLCAGLHDFMTQLNRKHIIINLDPASENLKYNKVSWNRKKRKELEIKLVDNGFDQIVPWPDSIFITNESYYISNSRVCL